MFEAFLLDPLRAVAPRLGEVALGEVELLLLLDITFGADDELPPPEDLVD